MMLASASAATAASTSPDDRSIRLKGRTGTRITRPGEEVALFVAPTPTLPPSGGEVQVGFSRGSGDPPPKCEGRETPHDQTPAEQKADGQLAAAGCGQLRGGGFRRGRGRPPHWLGGAGGGQPDRP